MYCKKCGKELPENARFCINCGNSTLDDTPTQKTSMKNYYSYSFYLMLVTSPLMFILRMLCQKTRTEFGWREYTVYYVPNHMRAIMVVLMGILVGSSLYLKYKSEINDKKSNIKLYLGWIISIIISFVVIFME